MESEKPLLANWLTWLTGFCGTAIIAAIFGISIGQFCWLIATVICVLIATGTVKFEEFDGREWFDDLPA